MLAAFGGPALEGTAGAKLGLSGPLAAPEAVVTLTVPNLRPGGASGRDIPPAELTVNARVGDGRLTSDLRLAKLTEKPITASLTAPVTLALQPFAFAMPENGAINGRLDADADLARIAALAALDGQSVQGRMNAAMQISGTLAQPQVNGRVDVGPARIEDSVTGVLYRNVRLTLDASGRRIVVSQLSADGRNNGRITGTGEVTLGADGQMPYRLETKLAKAEVLRNDIGTVIMSGDIGINGDTTMADLKGRLEILRADINIPDNSGPTIPVLHVEEVGQGIEPAAGPAPSEPFDLNLDIAVNAPARLFVRGRGLDSEWGGSFTVKGTATEAQVLGDIQFRRGFLDFLDRRFKVRSGSIAFSGARPPIPEVNIEAESQGESVLALVKITGPANDPKLDLTSEPPLPRDEVLAQLLFKRDMSQITPAQGVRLANAVATLEGRGIDVIGKFRSGLGLDTLDVGGETAGDANVRAGKYLADNVYFEMQQGMQSGSGKARVEVELTPNVTVSTEVSEQSQTGVALDWKLDY
jgi:translocation and assembly module TamB